MNQNLTDLNIILDESGSMQGLLAETLSGLNLFLKGQRDADGDANVTFVKFSSKVNMVYNAINLKDLKDITTDDYCPAGYTALLDAIGKTIESTGQRLAAMNEEDRPAKVLFLIQTDGDENASLSYKYAQIKEMITEQTQKYNWDFVFVGANQDAILAGASLGIGAANSLNYNANAASTQLMFTTLSDKTGIYRSAGGASLKSTFFDDSDRQDVNV